jgi:transposase
VTEVGCIVHALRKLFEPARHQRGNAHRAALRYIQLLYEIESEVRYLELDLRRQIRQGKAVPVMGVLHAWMIARRDLVPEGSDTSRELNTA